MYVKNILLSYQLQNKTWIFKPTVKTNIYFAIKIGTLWILFRDDSRFWTTRIYLSSLCKHISSFLYLVMKNYMMSYVLIINCKLPSDMAFSLRNVLQYKSERVMGMFTIYWTFMEFNLQIDSHFELKLGFLYLWRIINMNFILFMLRLLFYSFQVFNVYIEMAKI